MEPETWIIIAVVGFVSIWFFVIYTQFFNKKGNAKDIVTPETRSGRKYLLDDTLHSGGGDIIGGQKLTQDRLRIDIQTTSGVRSKDYFVNQLEPHNKMAHIIGGEQERWIYLGTKARNLGDNIYEKFEELDTQLQAMIKKSDELKTENEQLKSNIELYKDQVIDDTERIIKSGKPMTPKRPM